LRDKPADMLAASPKGTVPVLVLANEVGTVKVIDQSLDIMLWALRQNDPYHWLENEEEALALIAQCDGDFKFHLDRYKYPNRYDGVHALEHRAKASIFVDTINNHLQNKALKCYTFNSNTGIYYAAYMPFLRQFAHTDKTWFAAQRWTYLQAQMAVFETSNAFKAIMQPHAPLRTGLA
jgi:glutathione S-transferase